MLTLLIEIRVMYLYKGPPDQTLSLSYMFSVCRSLLLVTLKHDAFERFHSNIQNLVSFCSGYAAYIKTVLLCLQVICY